jgi:hypothetical protein
MTWLALPVADEFFLSFSSLPAGKPAITGGV